MILLSKRRLKRKRSHDFSSTWKPFRFAWPAFRLAAHKRIKVVYSKTRMPSCPILQRPAFRNPKQTSCFSSIKPIFRSASQNRQSLWAREHFLETNEEPRMLETTQTHNATNTDTLPSFMHTERTGTTPLMTSMDRSLASNQTEGSSRQPVDGLKRKIMRLPFPGGLVANK